MRYLFFASIVLALPLPDLPTAQTGRPEKRAGKKKPAPAAEKEPVKAGDVVPMFALRQFGGDFVFLKRYCGKTKTDQAIKAVLLDFFSTDCTACIEKLPEIQALAGQYSPRLKTFLISIDSKPEDELPAFIKEKEVSLPVLTDMYQKTISNYGFESVPQTVLIGGDCKAIYVVKSDEKDFSALADRLKDQLKQ